ncbi:MAG TPA: ABC transporter permease [Candidatus Polarisedimenticolia bacterium]|nr:ABC transporter permease [Candidatus Polarisedimenticolia bacterium]
MRLEHWFYTVPLRLRSLFRRGQVEAELNEELRYHLERQIEVNTAAGMSVEEARYAALRAMHGLDQRKEECRDMRRVRLIEDLWQDFRFSLRSLLKRPGFTAIALLALALGIGANTAIFSLVNAVILQPLPYRDPDRLISVYGTRNRSTQGSVGPTDFLDYRSQNKTFEQFAASGSMMLPMNLTGSGEPERLNASIITGNYFDTFGVRPALGRGFSLENEKTGQDHVTVLSHAFWQTRFGGDPNIVNKTINLDGKAYEVLGVMPAEVVLPQPAQLWVPINFDADPEMKMRNARFLRGIGRLKEGVTLDQAQTDTDLIAAQLEQQYPDSNTGWSLRLIPLREILVGGSRTMLFILFGAVGFVLLIACANVANLLLVRAAARQKEIAMRTALGASRLRIIRQMITESLLLAIFGGALGALLAVAGVKLLVSLGEDNIPRTANVKIDATVLAFTLLISLATGLLFGLAPAIRTMKENLVDALKDGIRGGSEATVKNRTRSLLVVFESAIAVMLLIAAGLLIRSLVALQNVDPGFDPNNVLTLRVDLPRQKYNTPEKASNFFEQLETRVAGLPGVEAVGLITDLPLSGEARDMPYRVEGRPATSDIAFVDFRRVNKNYFSAMRIPLRRGRNFTEQEVRQSDKAIVVSQAFVDSVFPNEEALGKRLIIWSGIRNEPYEIIGIVGDTRYQSLQGEPSATMYVPTREFLFVNLVIRTQGDPLSLVGGVRKEVNALDPDQPIAAIRPMTEWVAMSAAGARYRTTLLGLFALLAMILAATGIYGVMSYSVAQRTQEIGVRMALGARPLDVLKLVVRQGMMLALIGVIVGLAGALALTRVMSSLLFGVTERDPITFVAVAALLIVVAFISCFVPAHRATRVDPLIALRCE